MKDNADYISMYSEIPLSPMEKLRKLLEPLQAASSSGDNPDQNPPRSTDEDDGDDGTGSAELGNSPQLALRKKQNKRNEINNDFNM